MFAREYVIRALEGLGEAELQEVADYLAFLKFRTRARAALPRDVTEFASLYAEFAEEDRRLADEGMEEYANGLLAEDEQ